MAQPLRIDLDLFVNLRDAGCTDELADTANYGTVAERVAEVVRANKDMLLERLADRVAQVVIAIDRVEAIEVTVTKLRPPVPEQLESTAVHIRRYRGDYNELDRNLHLAIVALGFNLGDRENYLRLAVASLPNIQAMSQVFETDPIGGPADQDPHLNMVVAVHTTLDPYAFLRRCRRIEADALRQRVVCCEPRTLDIDLLFYDNIRIEDPQLTIPHPRFAERRFVLTPLAEVDPTRCPPNWDKDLPLEGVYPRGPLALFPDTV